MFFCYLEKLAEEGDEEDRGYRGPERPGRGPHGVLLLRPVEHQPGVQVSDGGSI